MRHRRSPESAINKHRNYLRNIQWQCSQIVFSLLLDKGIARRRNSTKHDKPSPLKIKGHTPRQRIRRNSGNNYINTLPMKDSLPTASLRCPLANLLARLFRPISRALYLTISPVTTTPLPSTTTVTSTLFLVTQACRRSYVEGSCGGARKGRAAPPEGEWRPR